MESLVQLLSNPLVLKVLIGYWIFSAFVSKMPSPNDVVKVKPDIAPMTLLVYQTVFGFLHGIAGSVSRAAIAFKVPGAVEDKG